MLSHNDQPNVQNFNFAVDSLFNNSYVMKADVVPILINQFLLLDDEFFLLLDGDDLILLGN